MNKEIRSNGSETPDAILIRVADQWDDALLREVSAFAERRPESSPWEGRWSSGVEYFRWKCADCPLMPAIVALAYDGGMLVGMATASFKAMRDGKESFVVAELGDLYVAAEKRGRGVFRRLVEAAVVAAQARGAMLVYSVPNQEGFEALIAGGRLIAAPQCEHATWLLPLRPFALVANRVRPLRVLVCLDWPWRLLLSLRRRTFSALALPSIANEIPPEEGEMRVAYAADYLSYRVLRHPDAAAYSATGLSGSRHGSALVVLRHAKYDGLPVCIGARLWAGDLPDFSTSLQALEDAAWSASAAFVALWAPRRGRLARTLRWRGFIPVQRKRIAVAIAPGSDMAGRLERLHLDMLDSDKA